LDVRGQEKQDVYCRLTSIMKKGVEWQSATYSAQATQTSKLTLFERNLRERLRLARVNKVNPPYFQQTITTHNSKVSAKPRLHTHSQALHKSPVLVQVKQYSVYCGYHGNTVTMATRLPW